MIDIVLSRLTDGKWPFDPCEPDSGTLIGRRVFTLDHGVLVSCIAAQFLILHIFSRHFGSWHYFG